MVCDGPTVVQAGVVADDGDGGGRRDAVEIASLEEGCGGG